MSHARLDRLWTGGRWCEGPVYVPAWRCLIWSDIPNDRLLRWDEADGHVSTFRQPADNENGHTLDPQGRLVSCVHRARRVIRTEPDGTITVLADRYEGRRLNSPNDVVVAADGAIWFTDPPYGIDSDYEGDRASGEVGAHNVYRRDPSGALAAVITDMVCPNGLAFSPDGRLLYVADTGRTHRPGHPAEIRAYDVDEDGRGVSGGRQFATTDAGLFDGFRADEHGNLWCSSADGVRCHAPDGTLIGRVPVPEVVSNVAFGGPKRNRLFITATTSLYSVYLKVRGAFAGSA